MSEPSQGLASIVIPVYNRPRLLADAVTSALAQTYRPIEIVIVDDGSTDGTLAVARAFAARHPDLIRIHQQSNTGPALARNAGLSLAAGEFIQFLDSDDVLMPEKLTRQIAALRDGAGYGLSYCYVREYPIGDALPTVPARRSGTTMPFLFPEILKGRVWPTVSPLYRRSVIDACGGFCDSRRYEDWEFETRVAALGVGLHHCREFLADMRIVRGESPPAAARSGLQSHRDAVEMHARILGHARAAGVAPDALAAFALRLFEEARLCAWHGLEPDARRCLQMGLAVARTPWQRAGMRAYSAAGDAFGWHRVGRGSRRIETAVVWRAQSWGAVVAKWWRRARLAPGYAWRRSREVWS